MSKWTLQNMCTFTALGGDGAALIIGKYNCEDYEAAKRF